MLNMWFGTGLVVILAMSCVTSMPYYEEQTEEVKKNDTEVIHCLFETPCSWRIVNFADRTVSHIVNPYCTCSEGKSCQFYVRRHAEGTSEYRCI